MSLQDHKMDQPDKAKMALKFEFMKLARKCNLIPLCRELEVDTNEVRVNSKALKSPFKFHFSPDEIDEKEEAASTPRMAAPKETHGLSAGKDGNGAAVTQSSPAVCKSPSSSNDKVEATEPSSHGKQKPFPRDPEEQRVFKAIVKQGGEQAIFKDSQDSQFKIILEFKEFAAWIATNVQHEIKRVEEGNVV